MLQFWIVTSIIIATVLHAGVLAKSTSKGVRVFGIQLSNPEAPEAPIIAAYVPSTTEMMPPPMSSLPHRGSYQQQPKFHQQIFPQQRRKDMRDLQKKKETIDAAIRDVPDDWLPLVERHGGPAVSALQGNLVGRCPNAFELTEHGKCRLIVYSDPVVSCPYGSYRNSEQKCEQVDSIPPEFVCPALFEVFLRGCIKRTRIPATLSCSPGYRQYDDACIQHGVIRATPECPLGFLLTQDSHDISKVECIRQLSTPPVANCPAGYTRLTLSILTRLHAVVANPIGLPLHLVDPLSNKPHCIREVEEKPQFVCPEGYLPERHDGNTSETEDENRRGETTPMTTTATKARVDTDNGEPLSNTQFNTPMAPPRLNTTTNGVNEPDRQQVKDPAVVKSDGMGVTRHQSKQREARWTTDTSGEAATSITTTSTTSKPASTAVPLTRSWTTTTTSTASVASTTSTTDEQISAEMTGNVSTLSSTRTTKIFRTASHPKHHKRKTSLRPSEYQKYLENVNEDDGEDNEDDFETDEKKNEHSFDREEGAVLRGRMLREANYYDYVALMMATYWKLAEEESGWRTESEAQQLSADRRLGLLDDGEKEVAGNYYKFDLRERDFERHLEADQGTAQNLWSSSRAKFGGKPDNHNREEHREADHHNETQARSSSKTYHCTRHVLLTPATELDLEGNTEGDNTKEFRRKLFARDQENDDEFSGAQHHELRSLRPSQLAIEPLDRSLLKFIDAATGLQNDENAEKSSQTSEGFFELEVLQVPSITERSEDCQEHGRIAGAKNVLKVTHRRDDICGAQERTPAVEILEVFPICADGYVLTCKNEEWLTNDPKEMQKEREDSFSIVASGTETSSPGDECEAMCRRIDILAGEWMCKSDHLELRVSSDRAPRCEGIERVPAALMCPHKALSPNDKGLCDTLFSQPLSKRCPEDFHIGAQERDREVWGPRKASGWSHAASDVQMIPGLCERVEYADYQTICPIGYEKTGKGNKKIKVCTARKIVPPAYVCEPGFQRVVNAEGEMLCLKELEAAPSLVPFDDDYNRDVRKHPMAGAVHGDVSVCQFSSDGGSLSCSKQRRFYGDVTAAGLRWGNRFKSRMDGRSG